MRFIWFFIKSYINLLKINIQKIIKLAILQEHYIILLFLLKVSNLPKFNFIIIKLRKIKMKTNSLKTLKQQNIKDIFQKDYQLRSPNQHKLTTAFLQPYFETLPVNTVKLITFYIEVIQPTSDLYSMVDEKQLHGILIKVSNNLSPYAQRNPQADHHSYVIIKNQKIEFTQNQSFGLFINYTNYLSCLSLGQSTIQQQLNFFNTSQYLCSMPKKKYYTILRNSKILSFTSRQNIYFEGQMIESGESGSGVYLVRLGEMGYFKKIRQRNVQVYRFSSGHLVGTLELEKNLKKRLFNVKCKSSRCVVYNINEEFFNSFIRPYCQNVLQQKQKKLEKFLSDRSNQVTEFRQSRPQLGMLSLRKSYSQSQEISDKNNLNSLRKTQMFTSRDLPSLIKTSRLSAQIQQQQLRKTSYMQIKYGGPLKHYPMVSSRSKFMQSQFKDIQKLIQKNNKIDKIRSISKIEQKRNRNQILFQLFQTSWKFDKLKRKRMMGV